MIDVTEIDTSTTMLGTKVSVPFYITATALGKLGHPDGEKVLTRGAQKHDLIQMILRWLHVHLMKLLMKLNQIKLNGFNFMSIQIVKLRKDCSTC